MEEIFNHWVFDLLFLNSCFFNLHFFPHIFPHGVR